MVRGGTPDLAWRLMDAQYWASPRLARRQRIFLVADFGGRRSHEILFKPRPMRPLSEAGGDCGLSSPEGDRGTFLETGGRVPVTRPFQCFRMRASAKDRTPEAFRNSFGLPTDPFPTLLAGGVAPFAFWYEDDPAGGFVRFLTELECERLMGLPEGWTNTARTARKYGRPAATRRWGTPSPCPVPSTLWRGSRRCCMTLFEAYVTNAGKYADYGVEVGEPLKFPTTTEEVQALLKRIGVDGVRYQEIFIVSFDGDVLGLYDYLSEYENSGRAQPSGPICSLNWIKVNWKRWRPFSTRATILPAWPTSSTSFTIWTATICTPAYRTMKRWGAFTVEDMERLRCPRYITI